MEWKLMWGMLALTSLSFGQNLLTVTSQTMREQETCRIELRLEEPADSVQLELSSYNRPCYVNERSSLPLTDRGNGRRFATELRLESFFHPVYDSGWPSTYGKFMAVPVVTRGGKTVRMPAQNLWNRLDMPGITLPMTANGVLKGKGRFGDGLFFDGKAAMASVKMPFDGDCGSLEAWVFLPLVLQKESGILCFVQSADGGPWRYHCLEVPANSRKIRYFTYNGCPGNAVHSIVSPEITKEDWVHVLATFDVKTKTMALYVDGQRQGTAEYPSPCGGKKASMSLGARIHYAGASYRFISACQLMLDEVRISRSVREPKIPARPHVPDGATRLLLSFDGPGYMGK